MYPLGQIYCHLLVQLGWVPFPLYFSGVLSSPCHTVSSSPLVHVDQGISTFISRAPDRTQPSAGHIVGIRRLLMNEGRW